MSDIANRLELGAGSLEVGVGTSELRATSWEWRARGSRERGAWSGERGIRLLFALRSTLFAPHQPTAEAVHGVADGVAMGEAEAVLLAESLYSDRYIVIGHWRDWVSGVRGKKVTGFREELRAKSLESRARYNGTRRGDFLLPALRSLLCA